MSTETKPQLIRALKLRDLVLLNLVAVLGLRHLGTSAKAGPTTLLLWVLAALFFFVPQGLVVTELSSRFPDEGGVYFWTKRALGDIRSDKSRIDHRHAHAFVAKLDSK